MTTSLRNHARELGWPARVAKSLMVDPTFSITADDAADEWEYGAGSRPPAPAIRHYQNRTDDDEAIFLGALDDILTARGLL